MNWDHLRAFLTLVRHGSVRQAALVLGTTHSTVARQLKALELALGAPLFEPAAQGRVLSALGHRILPLAERMETDAQTIGRVAFAEDTSLAGPVCLSVSESLYLSVLAPCLNDFLDRYPMIALELVISDQLSSLHRRDADVVIRITRSPPDSAIGRKVAASPLCPYASAAYLQNRPKLDHWIAIDYDASRAPVLPARTIATASSLTAATRLVSDGRGIAMIPCYQGDTDPRLRRVPGCTPSPDMDIWVLTHEDLTSSPRVRVLMDHLYRAFGELAPLIGGLRPRAG